MVSEKSLREELQRFAAEELRSELNMLFSRLEEQLRSRSHKASASGNSAYNSVGEEEDADDPKCSGWMGRFRANIKVPLGDGLSDTRTKGSPRNASNSYTALPDDGPAQDPSSCREVHREEVQLAAAKRRASRKESMPKQNSGYSRVRRHSVNNGNQDRSCLQETVDNIYFEYAVCCVIFANALVMGLEANWQVHEWTVELPMMYKIADAIFCFVFVTELLMRFCAFGTSLLSWKSPDWMWNYFDVIVVSMQIVETVFSFVGPHITPGLVIFKLLRIVRLCRCARVFRLVRAFRLVPELHMLVVTCGGSMRSLFWTVCILFFTTYTFGMYITQLVAEHGEAYPDDVTGEADLGRYFGSIQNTVFKLYQTMFNGDQWNRLTNPLIRDISPWLGFIYCLYIAFTVICLLNVITGVFLNSAMQTAEDDKSRRMIEQIRTMFVAGDADGSGQMNIEEFETHLDDPDMQLYLRAIGLIPDEAAELFYLLDKDGSGQISMEEFVHGCIRLRGNAKAVDFAVFEQQFEKLSIRLRRHMDLVEAHLSLDGR